MEAISVLSEGEIVTKLLPYQTIRFEEHDIRLFRVSGNTWFHLKDVCVILTLSSNRMVARRVSLMNRRVTPITDRTGTRDTNLVNEQGLFEVINQTDKVSSERKQKVIAFFQTKGYLLGVELTGHADKTLQSRDEMNFLHLLEEVLSPFGINGTRQYYCNKYRIDYYLSTMNVAIEYDEKDIHNAHRKGSDSVRQKYLENTLGCRFIRVSDINSNMWNIGYIIKNLFSCGE